MYYEKGKYTGYHYGGHPVWLFGDHYYKLLSKHRSWDSLTKKEGKSDPCDKRAKVGKWYFRLNRLPTDAAERIRYATTKGGVKL